MGGAKRLMEEQEARYHQGLQICIEAGLIEECEMHPGSYYDGSGELEDAYRYANAGVTAGRVNLDDGMSRRDLTDAIKDAYEDNSGIDYCSSCDRNIRD